jgi:hypothetical protein
MKNNRLLWLFFVLLSLFIFGIWPKNASASRGEQFQAVMVSMSDQQAAETPIPTESTSVAVIETPESRLLPPVGSNAGLVIGASVLVLIIISGVLSSRRRQNH